MTGKRLRTVADWRDEFLASGAVSQSQQANVKSMFKKMAKLVANTPDCASVKIQDAKGLEQIWESDIQQKLAEGKIAKNTARQYRMWAKKAINWAHKNTQHFAKEAQVEWLNQLDKEMWHLVDTVKKHGKYVERLAVERLFKFVSLQGHDFQSLTQNTDQLLEEFEQDLIQTGVTAKTWKSTYRDAIRGLKILQAKGLYPEMPLRPHTSNRIKPYGMYYEAFPNQELKMAVRKYDQFATKPPVLGDESWSHPPVTDTTRKNNLRALGQYIGFLESINGTDTSTLSMDEIFSIEKLEAFAVFYQKNQKNTGGNITSGLKSTLKRIKSVVMQTLDFFSDKEQSKRFDEVYKKRTITSKRPKELRIRSLSQWRAILDAIIERHKRAKNKSHKLAFRRLYTYILILLSAPARPGSVRNLTLGKNLIKDPISNIWRVHLSPEETKTQKAYRVPLPNFVSTELEDYLKYVRPQILNGIQSDFVFPSFEGGPVADNVILNELQKIDMQLHNIPKKESVYPHTVRHTTVITCARKFGKKALHSASKLLGHAALETTLKFYAQNARALADTDRQAERILEKEKLGKKDIEILMTMLAKEPKEMKRFRQAFEQECQPIHRNKSSPSKESPDGRHIARNKKKNPKSDSS